MGQVYQAHAAPSLPSASAPPVDPFEDRAEGFRHSLEAYSLGPPPFVLVVFGRRRTGVKRWYMVKHIPGSLPATIGKRVSQEELVDREKVLCTVSQRATEVFLDLGLGLTISGACAAPHPSHGLFFLQ